jgi:hypothetical protein
MHTSWAGSTSTVYPWRRNIPLAAAKSSRIAKADVPPLGVPSATVSVSGDTTAEIGRTAHCEYHSC